MKIKIDPTDIPFGSEDMTEIVIGIRIKFLTTTTFWQDLDNILTR